MRDRTAALILLMCMACPLLRAERGNPAQLPAGTVSVTSRIVVLDVVVLDHGQPVCGLKSQDFRVLEDGQPQSIQSSEAHCAEDLTRKVQRETSPRPLPPNTYSNLPAHPAIDSVTVLLLDGLNTQVSDNQHLRRQMLEYLKNLPAGHRIAIFALGSHLRLLQGFTTNSGQLLAAMANAKATPAASLLPSAEDRSQEQQMIDWLTEAGGGTAAGLLSQSDKESDIEQAGFRVGMTLEALDQLARYLSGIPGHKNLIWFSGSFPVQFSPGNQLLPNGMGSGTAEAQYLQKLKETADLLDSARVAVYPVDIRGPVQEPMFTAAQNQDYGAVVQNKPVGEQRFKDDTLQAQASLDSQDTAMDLLAKETGGQATYGSNALKQAVANAISDGENFYTITYAPRNNTFDGTWRKITVSVGTKPASGKYKLLYRDGYYASNAALAKSIGGQRAGKALGVAMQDGAPPSSQILFEAKVVASHGHPPTGPIRGQNQSMKNRAARYAIDYAISLQNVNLAVTSQGTHTGKLYVETVAYGDDGKVVNGTGNINSVALAQLEWDRLAQDKLRVHQMLDLPEGNIQLRLGVYDPASGNVGSMQISLRIVAKQPAEPAAVTQNLRRESASLGTAAKPISVAAMDQLLDVVRGRPDGKLQSELDDVQLTERVSNATLASWDAEFPGAKSRDTLMKLADLSAFLNPSAADVMGDPPPTRQAQIKMLAAAVHYVMTTMSQLPDFYATRITTHFQDTLSQLSGGTWLGQGIAGLHPAGAYSRTVTYRNGEEVPFDDKGKRETEPALGLTSSGEFGQILVQVIGDAIKNGLGFVRWEKGATGPSAVFAYKVPANASHFPVKFVIGGKVLTMLPAYHGEIAIDPNTGGVLRLSEIADMAPQYQELRAAIEVDYAPVTIGGRSYILPTRSIAFSKIPVTIYNTGTVPGSGGPQQGTETDLNTWPIQTDMNDVAFTDYHQFRATVRLLPSWKEQTTTKSPDNKAPASMPQY